MNDNMADFSYLRMASKIASQRQVDEAKEIHAELALRAGVSPDEYVSPWIKAGKLLGSGGMKRIKALHAEDVSHLVVEKHDLTCVIITFKKHLDGRMKQVLNVANSMASYERILGKFESRDNLKNKEKLA